MEIFLAAPHADVSGTHFEDVVLNMRYPDLVRVLGNPHEVFEHGDKIQYRWVFQGVSDGPRVTVYDWKQYETRSPREWHVGARRRIDAIAFKKWFEGRCEAIASKHV